MAQFKVVCIKDGEWRVTNKWYKRFFWSKPKNPKEKGPKKDDVVTVVSELWMHGKKWYKLLEWPTEGHFSASSFRPVEEDTTEFKEVTYSEIKKAVPLSAQ